MMFGRSIFGIVSLTVAAKWLKLAILGHQRWMLLSIGVAGMGSLTCLVASLILVPLVEALLLFYLYIAFAALLSPYLTHEKMRPIEWLFIGTAFFGTILVLWPSYSSSSIEWGHFLALAAAFGNGLTMTLIRRISHENNPLTPYFYVSVVGCVVCPVLLLWQDIPILIALEGFFGLVTIAILAALAHLFTNKALSFLPAPKVGVISLFEVVFGGVCGFMLFDESIGLRSLIGAALILCSGVCLNLKSEKRA